MSAFGNASVGLNGSWYRADFSDARAANGNWTGRWDADSVRPWADGALWPWSRWNGGIGWFGGDTSSLNRWAQPPEELGGQQQLKLIGITRDSNGAVLGTAVVQAFRTADDLFVQELTSDAGGYFEVTTPYASTSHYLVAYKAGSPDVAGTTVNTLQPA